MDAMIFRQDENNICNFSKLKIGDLSLGSEDCSDSLSAFGRLHTEDAQTRMLPTKSVWSMEMFPVHKHLVKLPGNPRWLPNHVTYIVPDTLAQEGALDHFTM